MSTWRKKAIECLPELRREFEEPEANIYTVFFELRPATIEAHKKNDIISLKRFYDFAEWCFKQKEKELWNAAGVAFYEHMGEAPESRTAMPDWVKPEIYKEIRGLLKLFMNLEDLHKLDNSYKAKFPKEFKG
jgi:hypothetical protein